MLNKSTGAIPNPTQETCNSQSSIYEFDGFAYPKGVCYLQGLIYVADSDSNTIHILGIGTGIIGMLNFPGLNLPSGLSYSPEQNRLWVCSTGANQVI